MSTALGSTGFATTSIYSLKPTWDSAEEEERRPRMMAPTRCTSHVSCPSITASA